MTESADTLANTLSWFQAAVPYPTSKNIHTQIGCHFEEVREMIQTLHSTNIDTLHLLSEAENALHALALHLKSRDNVITVRPQHQVEFLDAVCDQIVTATGCSYMLNHDILGGMKEVNASNWSKFVGGRPVFDANHKIQKGPGYFKADLSLYVPMTD